jgi:hypothetical protein
MGVPDPATGIAPDPAPPMGDGGADGTAAARSSSRTSHSVPHATHAYGAQKDSTRAGPRKLSMRLSWVTLAVEQPTRLSSVP